MIELASVQEREDDRVAELLLAAVPEAHRLASWILRDPAGAEDAVQEALLRAWSRRRSIRFELSEPRRWFLRIVVNVCRDELRRRRRQPVTAVAPARSVEAADAVVRRRGDLPRFLGAPGDARGRAALGHR
jgi:RNA polymerase sigma-70 factor (ECF subfamily)